MSKKDRILKLLKEGKAVGEVAKAVKVKPGYVYYIRWMDLNKSGAKALKKKAKKPSKIVAAVKEMDKAITAAVQREKELAPLQARDKRLTKDNRAALKYLEDMVVESKPTKLFVRPEHKDAALKLLGMKEADLVNHPPHYKTGGIDTLDFIEAKDLNFRLANVVKYVVRCGKKLNSDPIQDLEKAAFYLKREIEARKSA